MMHQKIFNSSLWLLAGNSVQQIVQLGTFIMLARLLNPSTFGYVALASVVVDVAATIAMWGLVRIAQQRRGILTDRMLSHIFVFSIFIAVALSVLIATGVGIYSAVYDFGLTAQLILMLVPILLIQAVRIAPEGALYHNMEFKWLAIRNNIAALLGGAAAIVMAYCGLEVYALVIQKLVAIFCLTAVVWYAQGKRIRLLPIRQYSMTIFRSLAVNGGQIVSVPLAETFSGRAMDGLIGGFLGPAALGNFRISRRIYDLVQQATLEPFKTASAPAFSKLFGDPQLLEKLYLQVIMMTGLIVIPAFTGLGMTAPEWVPMVLGPQWIPAIPLFYILSISSVSMILMGLQISLLLAHRENKMVLYQNIITTLVLSALVYVGVQYDLQTTIAIYVAVTYAIVIFNQFLVKRITKWSFFPSFTVMIPAVLASGAMAVVIETIRIYWMPEHGIVALMTLIMAGGTTYVAIMGLILRRKLVPMIKQVLKRQPLVKES